MQLSEFNFDLPEHLIASQPVEPRDQSKLLYIGDNLKDLMFTDIIDLVEVGDVMVFNDTKVIPARLHGKRGNANIEVTLHKKTSDNSWKAFAKPAKKLKIDNIINFTDKFSAQVTDKGEGGEVELEFNISGNELENLIERIGEIPLPPYIASKRKVEEKDSDTYQTVFAKHLGAVAAPTAGLHYTDDVLKTLDYKGVIRAHITLHVGAGTFLPVKVDNIKDHKMHHEYYSISDDAAKSINKAKANGGRVIAVGTTALRALESATNDEGILQASSQETDIFITPGYKFKIVDILQTNFHTPKSTLLMLVSAFCGFERIKSAYKHAIDKNYRFYSYGDTCFLKKK